LIYYVVAAILSFVPVLILNDLVKFFESGMNIDEWEGYANPWVEVVGLGVIPVVVSLLQTRHFTIYSHCAVFVRTAVSTMLYRKALKVSAAGRAKTSTGQVVNMMSNDTAQLQRFLQFVGLTVVAPLQIIIALYFIYQQVSCLHALHLAAAGKLNDTLSHRVSSFCCVCLRLLGWKCYLGWCWIHDLLGTSQHHRFFDCVKTASKGTQVF